MAQSKKQIFFKAAREERLNADPKTIALVRIYYARYDFAKSFLGLQSAKFKENSGTLRGYNEGMRLFLAYTALEMIAEAIKKAGKLFLNSKFDIVGNQKLHTDLRHFLNPEKDNKASDKKTPLQRMQNALHDRDLSDALTAFAKGEKDNLTILAYAIRVMVAHGTFTAGGTKILSKKNAEIFRTLSNLVLEKSQVLFEEWLEKNLPNEV